MMTWDELDEWRSNQGKEWGQSEGYTEAIKPIPLGLYTHTSSFNIVSFAVHNNALHKNSSKILLSSDYCDTPPVHCSVELKEI